MAVPTISGALSLRISVLSSVEAEMD